METRIEFKTKKQLEEWWNIPHHNRKLQALALHAAATLKYFINLDPSVVTEIYRSPGEQLQQLKKGNTTVQVGPHQDWRAVDMRLNNLTAEQRKKIPDVIAYINAAWTRSDGFKTAIAHGEGDNFHLHLQLERAEIK